MRYVVAADGSEASLKAANFFVEHMGPGPDDEVFIVYVFPLPSDPELYTDVLSLPSQPDDHRVVKLADQVHRQMTGPLADLEGRVHRVTLVGNPAKEIVEFAMNMNVSMIVAGTRGQTPATELYLGSVSSALIHRAQCSVLIVR